MAKEQAPTWPIVPNDRISVRVNEAVRLTGLSRTTLYRLMAKDELKSAKIGHSRLILVESLAALVYRQANKDVADDAVCRFDFYAFRIRIPMNKCPKNMYKFRTRAFVQIFASASY